MILQSRNQNQRASMYVAHRCTIYLYLGWEIYDDDDDDDQIRNLNINNRDHLFGRPTRWEVAGRRKKKIFGSSQLHADDGNLVITGKGLKTFFTTCCQHHAKIMIMMTKNCMKTVLHIVFQIFSKNKVFCSAA